MTVATRRLAIGLALGVVAGLAPRALAAPGDDVPAVTDDDDTAPARKPAAKQGGDTSGALLQKQDLNGHDLGTGKRENSFERDRFFVDKVDTAKSEAGTLIHAGDVVLPEGATLVTDAEALVVQVTSASVEMAPAEGAEGAEA